MKAYKKKNAVVEKSISELNPWPSYIQVNQDYCGNKFNSFLSMNRIALEILVAKFS